MDDCFDDADGELLPQMEKEFKIDARGPMEI
ncbi:hypothetical protein GGD66_002347 [Bradyrhizobium sp. CIR48]|nr:hypothetical protein [Bradyrhizobium sp. CIR48]